MRYPTFILGAADPEMAAIEALLEECRVRFVYALQADWRRVRPENAAVATLDKPSRRLTAAASPLIAVECRIVGLEADQIIDHHAPGDPGFGRPPAEFLAASSIGQVIAALARLGMLPQTWQGSGCDDLPPPNKGEISGPDHTGGWWIDERLIPTDVVLMAAADHCLGAAYRGECPGVNPVELQAWRVRSRAAFQRRSPADIEADIRRASEAIDRAPMLDLGGGVMVRDLRGPVVPELPEAAMRLGAGYVSGPLEHGKYCCSGSSEQISAFTTSWAPREGLARIYGDPARGFAGGYMTED